MLRATLERLVDFDRIDGLEDPPSVGAVSVTTGNLRYFDNFEMKEAGVENRPGTHHGVRRAAAVGFPSIATEGEHYWDGGIASNTPLDYGA